MNILSILTIAAQSPLTGDNFPVIPLIIVGVLAVIIAAVSTIAAIKKKKKEDDE